MSSVLTTPFASPADNGDMTKKAIAHDDDLSTLGGRLAFLFRIRKTNPNRIEVSTGITRQAIGLMLKGTTGKPSWPVLVKLSDHLGVRPEWLADGEEPMVRAATVNDDAEARLLRDFREMSAGHKRDLTDIARRWAEEDADPRPDSPRHNVRNTPNKH